METNETTGTENKTYIYNYRTGAMIRPATADELKASREAARHDGGSGIIVVDGVKCFTME